MDSESIVWLGPAALGAYWLLVYFLGWPIQLPAGRVAAEEIWISRLLFAVLGAVLLGFSVYKLFFVPA